MHMPIRRNPVCDRSADKEDNNLTAFGEDPVGGDGHYRGSWAHSTIQMKNERYKVSCGLGIPWGLRVTTSVEVDIMQQADSWQSANATDNKGNWGVITEATICADKPTQQSETVDARFMATNTGAWYAGAGDPEDDSMHGIPKIKWGTSTDGTEVVMSITVGAGQTASKTLRIMHAGDADLPVGICLEKR